MPHISVTSESKLKALLNFCNIYEYEEVYSNLFLLLQDPSHTSIRNTTLDHQDAATYIDECIQWALTPQGDSYWSRLQDEWNEIYREQHLDDYEEESSIFQPEYVG